MKIFCRFFIVIFLVGMGSTFVYADSDKQQFEQGLLAYNKQDFHKAFELWKPLAEKGHADIQYNIGVMYEEGKGVHQDYMEAVRWYQKSAELGYAQSQFSLAIMYYKGLGVEQSYHQSVKWLKKAAEQGHSDAQFNLAVAYYKGHGVRQDDLQAKEYFGQACDNGDQLGCDYYRLLNSGR